MMLVMMLWYYDNGSPREYKIYNKSKPPKRRRVASVVCLQTIFCHPFRLSLPFGGWREARSKKK